MLTCDLDPKRFKLLLELVPEAKNVAVLVNPGNRQPGLDREAMLHQIATAGGHETAEALGLTVPQPLLAQAAEIIE